LSDVPPWDTWGYPVPAGTTAATLADQADRETAALIAAINALPSGVLEQPGTFDKWSALDVVAHCLAWAEICARVLHEMHAGTLDLRNYADLPVGDATEDELNERQVAALRGGAPEELVARLENVARDCSTTLRALDVDPPAQLVLLTVGDHFAEHADDLRRLADG
jgi:hypothetical protein